MAKFPLIHTLEVSQLTEATDRFGTVRTVPSGFEPLKVAGWAINKVEEAHGESVLRTIDQLDVYSPVLVEPSAVIRLPDGSEWQVIGNAEDFRHGPWWDPDLFVVHARKVEG